jgi:hypothetical protein
MQRSIFLFTALVAALCLMLAARADAYTIGLGADSRVVDTAQDTDGEVYNLEGLFLQLNHTVVNITQYDSEAAWVDLMAEVDVIVFPESENDSPLTYLTNATLDAIHNWVKTQHGVVIIFYDDYSLVNYLTKLSTSVGSSNSPWIKTAAANSSSIFESGPAELEGLDASMSWNVTNDAAVVECMYGTDEDCALWQYDMGTGRWFVAGPDYYDSAPRGSQDGGWVSVLTAAMSAVPAADSAAGRKNNFFMPSFISAALF